MSVTIDFGQIRLRIKEEVLNMNAVLQEKTQACMRKTYELHTERHKPQFEPNTFLLKTIRLPD